MFLALLWLAPPVAAGTSPQQIVQCLDAAATYHGVNNYVLRAIAWQESRANPNAMNINKNGTVDIGMMQINTVHREELARYGVPMEKLYDPCVAAYVAAWHYKKQIARYGNTWDAVGAYHSHTPFYRDRYAGQVRAILVRWGIVKS